MKRLLIASCAAFLSVASFAASGHPDSSTPPPKQPGGSQYPTAHRSDHVDTYFGVKVADPYRWMENIDSPDVQKWIAAENALTLPYLKKLPGQTWLKDRLTKLWKYERYGVPLQRGGRFFYTHNDGLQDQDVLFVAERPEAEGKVLLDPNTFSKDGTVALARWTPSWNGKLLAYGTSDGGTDWTTFHVVDVDSGTKLDDLIRFTKFTDVSWAHDDGGFYYSRYPLDAEGHADESKAVSVFFHKLGTPQSSDREIYALPKEPKHDPYAMVTEDGGYLIVDVQQGYDSNAIHVIPLKEGKPGAAIRLFDQWDALYRFVGNKGSLLYFSTTRNAPRGRVIAVDLRHPDPDQWTEVVPEQSETLSEAEYTGGEFFAQYLEDAHSRIRVWGADGEHLRDVELPGLGSAAGFAGPDDAKVTFYSYTSFTTPPTIYQYDIASGKSSIDRKPDVPVKDLDSFEVQQVFYPSKDGTKIPMFIVHRKGLKLDGTAPTLLYGYGGFDISLTPTYSLARIVWLEMGGVYAMPNLRGGGEYGEAWHEAGTKLHKQNVFDDFIAAAKYLEKEGYTSPSRLAISGASNGGLLIGAVLNQQPQLFGAALPAVGVMDMLRYQTASANAEGWSSDFGKSTDSREMFEALRAFSPVHNTREKGCFPPTLITTADHDNRVVPWYSFKYAAAMQHAQSCANPVLIRIETRAGHGAGKPTWMKIEEIADEYAFLAKALGIPMPPQTKP
ncbi:MAG: prolyl oligopeptidase family serine peptidase [Thermoanaerobaculia bacterium]